jgi:hypothetical protein
MLVACRRCRHTRASELDLATAGSAVANRRLIGGPEAHGNTSKKPASSFDTRIRRPPGRAARRSADLGRFPAVDDRARLDRQGDRRAGRPGHGTDRPPRDRCRRGGRRRRPGLAAGEAGAPRRKRPSLRSGERCRTPSGWIARIAPGERGGPQPALAARGARLARRPADQAGARRCGRRAAAQRPAEFGHEHLPRLDPRRAAAAGRERRARRNRDRPAHRSSDANAAGALPTSLPAG